MIAYKAFDKDLKCRDFQYEVGEEYEEEEAKLCTRGFHACENPLDTFRYYNPANGSRFCEVDLDATEEAETGDTKRCGKKIKILAEVGLSGAINASVKFIFEKCKDAKTTAASGESGNAAASGWMGNAAASGWMGNAAASGWMGNAAASGVRGNAAASGERGNAAASGVRGNAAASGERGNAAASGWMGNAAASGVRGTATVTGAYGNAEANGVQSLAVAWGYQTRAKGKVGTWLVLTEYYESTSNIKCAKIFHVDGSKIKEDVWYTLKNGRAVKANE